MSQESKQVFSTTQQIKLRQLQLEVETLEKQIENILGIEPESSSKTTELVYSFNPESNTQPLANTTPVYLIRAQKTQENTAIKLTYDRQS